MSETAAKTAPLKNGAATTNTVPNPAYDGISAFFTRIQAWYSNRNYMILAVIYGVLYLTLARVESYLEDASNLPTPFKSIDNQFTYTLPQLVYFLNQLGKTGRDWYLIYLSIETPFAFAGALLFSFTVGYIANILAAAEITLENQIERYHHRTGSDIPVRKAKPHLIQMRSIFLLFIPLVMPLLEMVENMLLMAIVLEHENVIECAKKKYDTFWDAMAGNSLDSVTGSGTMDLVAMLVFFTAGLTRYKWLAIRTGLAVTALTLFSGWTRVIIHFLYSGEAMFEGLDDGPGSMKQVFNDLVRRYRGITQGNDTPQTRNLQSMLKRGASTASSQGKVNNKKKSQRSKRE
ncbi:hypothetical protein BATDEDRAFT_87068 [Batrachochytrium dendrobatidis JAM81]|uniref:Uncharacterized protein n=1 Tax=Batrachochytrium dendrobatidis (strain JAM81 / FGSC 10211) TaxID=684364 RepID=F4NY83_BATDJ|nr:uncharacterized protein BATDEDRAFT_87068 [Batrachochytrium dendrobatidis JAM81]EGF82275.1 hypothetical protein BATDEDRAFT_87068 [Batrachochytrium dendrobatidis JAM81]KAJ8324336.1 hypothetical protein O5D80_006601 [Batrachochytrium dendrobatidis]KAK5670587.1 hypothetical protein QVD99_002373 [Batrachochytrium dendrobatidis]|eukprot:XP_006677691.1 hypothetical protein BATDEDRAFT_87068 [Batrachochytrium dendrobatidis JAM81]